MPGQHLMGLQASLQQAAQPDSVAPAVQGALAVAAEAHLCSFLQFDSSFSLCPQSLCVIPPLSQHPAWLCQAN